MMLFLRPQMADWILDAARKEGRYSLLPDRNEVYYVEMGLGRYLCWRGRWRNQRYLLVIGWKNIFMSSRDNAGVYIRQFWAELTFPRWHLKTGRIMSCYVNVVTLHGNESSCCGGRDLGFNLEPLDRWVARNDENLKSDDMDSILIHM